MMQGYGSDLAESGNNVTINTIPVPPGTSTVSFLVGSAVLVGLCLILFVSGAIIAYVHRVEKRHDMAKIQRSLRLRDTDKAGESV